MGVASPHVAYSFFGVPQIARSPPATTLCHTAAATPGV
jgi:hypothetical protein